MYRKEYYEAHKEQYKKYRREYYQTHKEEFRLYQKDYYQKNKKEMYRKNREYKAKDAKWKEYEKECSRLCNLFLYSEQIPELEYYGFVSDLNYQIEKRGVIYGSKC